MERRHSPRTLQLRRGGTLVLVLVLQAHALFPSPAAAEIYRYETEAGEVVLTTEPRADLKLLEIIGSPSKSSSNATATSSPSSQPKHQPRNQGQIQTDQTAHDALIREASEAYQMPFAFVKAVIKIESNFNTRAVSRVGAMGLMQLMPGTAEDMGVSDPFDARDNIFGGTKYLRMLANRYNGDINLVLAAYNAGPGNVDKYRGIPFESTRGYVQNVYRWYKRYQETHPNLDTSAADAQ